MKSCTAEECTRKRPVMQNSDINRIICWTRMQAEAGQDINDIISRKELERETGNGLFCWGIGNAPPRSLREIARRPTNVDVIFSLMKSRPKASDAAPENIWVWRSYLDLADVEHPLPPHVLVTSRPKSNGRSHYALMCHTPNRLRLSDRGAFDPSAYRNVSEAARPVGASQVTALLRRVAEEGEATSYRVNLLATLARPMWVRLSSPMELSKRAKAELWEALSSVRQIRASDWLQLAILVRGEKGRRSRRGEQQLALFG